MSKELGNQILSMFRGIYDATCLKYLRTIERHMFKCGHDCDEKNYIKQPKSRTDECGKPMYKPMTIVQREVKAFQRRIERRLMDCQDSGRNESRAKAMFEVCAEKCVNKFVPEVPRVMK